MKNLSLIRRISTTCSKLMPGLALLGLLSICAGCNFSQKPSGTVESLLRADERGDIEQALTFFSGRMINKRGIGPLRADLSSTTAELKEHGGVKSIKVLNEEVVGEAAEVTVEITRGNGDTAAVRYKLIKEQGAWKIDDVTSASSPEGVEDDPAHPESAVDDVVKWARGSQAARIRSWLQKQAPPLVCTMSPADLASLPDEVRYHEVDDPKVKERLLNAIDPVLKLVGCSDARGVSLYDDSRVYAFNLGDGRIAITPGHLYYDGTSADEQIFHSSAELRIFLAREVFRQLVPLEKPGPGLNEADMRLREELKLDYLAAIASLAVDHDPAILDGMALEIDLFGRPVGISSGRQGVPALRQIKDVFGAAKQDYVRNG
jgi:hypothetical protein